MIKRILALVLAAVLMAASSAALADTTYTIEARGFSFNRCSATMAYMVPGEDTYALYDIHGNKLTTEAYTEMTSVSGYSFWKVEVASEDGVHDEGLIDSAGAVVVPPIYADVDVVTSRWATGIKLTPCSADDKDYTYTNYSSNEKSFYRIDTVDFYYRGQLAGTLTRSEYSGYPTAHGDYICVQNREGQRYFYDKTMSSRIESDSSGEYNSVYKNGKYTYYHRGTGQAAFVPECTLTADEVEDSVLFDSGAVYDLQGREIARLKQNYDYFYDVGDGYMKVKMYGKYGLIDSQGNELIPIEYDDLGNYSALPLRYGYISAVKDGKFGFVNTKGEVTCEFVYANEAVKNCGTFATIKNLDGTTIVLSAAVGELPEHYSETRTVNYDGSACLIAKNTKGEYGLIGLNGEAVVPFSEDIRDIYAAEDGTAAVTYLGNRQYCVYVFDQAPVAADNAAGDDDEGPVMGGDDAPVPANDDTWTCANGHSGQTGKFCGECGSPRPVVEDDGTWTCANGHGGQTGKFCSECGSPRPNAN